MISIINMTIGKFSELYCDKRVICFGAGVFGKVICEMFERQGLCKHIDFFVDNDDAKWNSEISIGNSKFKVFSPEQLTTIDKDNTIIFITSRFWHEIVDQMDSIPYLSNVTCAIYILFKTLSGDNTQEYNNYYLEEEIIPKKIHYCWFGGGELPQFALNCIASWKKYCPDYEIIRWDENNYDIDKNDFTREVVREKHFSALSSYARFDIIHQHGGIYFDTDVEVVKNIDCLLHYKAFMGFEVSNYVNSGHGFGGVRGNKLFAENVDIYDHMTFLDESGKFNYIGAPIITTNMLKSHGLILNGNMQNIEGTTIFPSEYFDPALQIATEKSFSVHKYSSLWSLKGKDMEKIWENQRIKYRKLMDEGRINTII